MTTIINRLYDARNDIGDPRLKELSLRPFPGEIWIYHNPEASLT